MPLAEMLAAPAYHAARAVLGTAASIYFRRIDCRHVDRVPARGPLLVVANHPASFTDVVVLALAIPRRLHFLAMAPIFKPWIRGFALRMCGTLPLYRRQDDPTLMSRNDDTFRACHEFLDRGGAVLIFPEGTSLTDRQIVQLKTGAARLALAQEQRPGQSGALTLLPVGIHFADRTGFWTDAAVAVGKPIALAPFVTRAGQDEPDAVRELTAHIQTVLEKLILHIPESDQVSLVHAIEDIYRDDLDPARDGRVDLEGARGIAECIEYYSRVDPERIAAARGRVQAYTDRLASFRIQDETVRQMLPAERRLSERLRLFVLGLLGVIPALIGGLIHYVPYRLSGAASQLSPDPTRTASFRIGVAVVVFPATYAVLAWVLWGGLGWPPGRVAAALAISAALGLHALLFFNWLSRQSRRIRLVLLKTFNRRAVASLRRERLEIIRMCDTSKREFLAVTRPEGSPPQA